MEYKLGTPAYAVAGRIADELADCCCCLDLQEFLDRVWDPADVAAQLLSPYLMAALVRRLRLSSHTGGRLLGVPWISSSEADLCLFRLVAPHQKPTTIFRGVWDKISSKDLVL
jgi:hypothetical protein